MNQDPRTIRELQEGIGHARRLLRRVRGVSELEFDDRAEANRYADRMIADLLEVEAIAIELRVALDESHSRGEASLRVVVIDRMMRKAERAEAQQRHPANGVQS